MCSPAPIRAVCADASYWRAREPEEGVGPRPRAVLAQALPRGFSAKRVLVGLKKAGARTSLKAVILPQQQLRFGHPAFRELILMDYFRRLVGLRRLGIPAIRFRLTQVAGSRRWPAGRAFESRRRRSSLTQISFENPLRRAILRN